MARWKKKAKRRRAAIDSPMIRTGVGLEGDESRWERGHEERRMKRKKQDELWLAIRILIE